MCVYLPIQAQFIIGQRQLGEERILVEDEVGDSAAPEQVALLESTDLVRALELYLARDHGAEERRREATVAGWVESLGRLPGVRARHVCPVPAGINPVTIPRTYVEWNEEELGLTAVEAQRRLRQGPVGVAVHATPGRLVLNPQTVAPGEEKIVAEQVAALFRGAG